MVACMKKEEFEALLDEWSGKLTPIITKMFNDNREFFCFSETVKWAYGYDDDTSIMATCNRNTNVISFNLCALIHSWKNGDMKTVEYFLLHETRHVFQRLIVADYKNGLEIPISEEIVKKWIFEGEHYVKSLNEEGEENKEYFEQDSEMDAYAFSLAVMKYKYKNVEGLYVPPCYDKEFYKIVEEFIQSFGEGK